MDELKKFITEKLKIPYIDENNRVHDGSFALTPVITTGFYGNGVVIDSIDYYDINLFYTEKESLVENAKALFIALNQNKTPCSAPGYTYEKDGKIWRASLQVKK